MNSRIPMRLSFIAAAVSLLSFGLHAQAAGANSAATPESDVSAAVMPKAAIPYAAPANVFITESSKRVPADAGVRAHTNYFVRAPSGIQPRMLADMAHPEPEANPGPNATQAEYPASLACVYKIGTQYSGCRPTNNSSYNATGGQGVIAIVIAFHNPTFEADLTYFHNFFGFTQPLKYNRVIANGNGSCVTPPTNSGWALEAAMDTQWSHAMAPNARIVLVEACSNSYVDLMYAEQVAITTVQNYGGGQITNSWSSGEFSTESSDWDWVFRSNWVSGKPVTFFFSAGDAGLGAEYPSSSPWVVSAGGTTINRDASGAFSSESCWAGSGGGTSLYETYSSTFGTGTGPWTNFQYPLFGQSARRTPDMSFNADPASGAWVYYAGNWYVVGGTSLSAPALAGIVNNSSNRLGVAPIGGGYYSNMENNLLYAQLFTAKEYKNNFYDVTTGNNGAAAGPGWDYCTGVGSPRGKFGK